MIYPSCVHMVLQFYHVFLRKHGGFPYFCPSSNCVYVAKTFPAGVTNRFYFSFLNDAQWRVLSRNPSLRSALAREEFGRALGAKLYRSILEGEDLKSETWHLVKELSTCVILE